MCLRPTLDSAARDELRATFGLREASERDGLHSQPVAAWLDAARCAELLDDLAVRMEAPTRRVAASLLTKRLGFLTTGVAFHALSAFDRRLDLTPGNVWIEDGHAQGRWRAMLPLIDTRPLPALDDHATARALLARTLFGDLLRPLWETLARVGRVSPRILWENAAVRLYALYDRRLTELADPAIRARCAEDFAWLLAASPSELGLETNPLAQFRRPATANSAGRAVRFRRTCCFYYQATTPAEYCSNCPLIRPREA
ncbi:IucA/IucC family C-terminal-domain containing protein [Pseudomonas sp. Marseille-Q7302]